MIKIIIPENTDLYINYYTLFDGGTDSPHPPFITVVLLGTKVSPHPPLIT